MEKGKKANEGFVRAFSGRGSLDLKLEAHLVGAAYEGHPTQEKALVYVFGGKEYLVPFVNKWEGARVTESIVRLDLVERVISRPHATSRISEMLRSRKISDEARIAILNGIHAWFVPDKGYAVRIVPFEAEAAPMKEV